jgi:cytidyltransferase-like protein
MFADPFHCGHLECLKKAKELGDYLLVFVDSDRKAVLKKGFIIMSENERAEIIRNIKCVDEVIIIDTSIAEALEKYSDKINVFAKGGDRIIENLPLEEIEVCEKYNIEIICGLGDKIQASSLLIDKSSVIKPWGKYNVISQGFGYLIKKISINPHNKISLQYHKQRKEYWTVQKGLATILFNYENIKLNKGDNLFIDKEIVHRISNESDDILEIIEVQLGICDELDVVRLEDDFGRVNN